MHGRQSNSRSKVGSKELGISESNQFCPSRAAGQWLASFDSGEDPLEWAYCPTTGPEPNRMSDVYWGGVGGFYVHVLRNLFQFNELLSANWMLVVVLCGVVWVRGTCSFGIQMSFRVLFLFFAKSPLLPMLIE